MTIYSDTTQEVLKRVLTLLEPQVPSCVLQRIREFIERGTFQNVDEVLKTIEETLRGVEDNANS